MLYYQVKRRWKTILPHKLVQKRTYKVDTSFVAVLYDSPTRLETVTINEGDILEFVEQDISKPRHPFVFRYNGMIVWVAQDQLKYISTQ